jgi:hypothetical protein
MLRAHNMSSFTVRGTVCGMTESFDFHESKISTRVDEHTVVFLDSIV